MSRPRNPNPPTKRCERCGRAFAKDRVTTLARWERRRFCSLECSHGTAPPPVERDAPGIREYWTVDLMKVSYASD